MLVIINPNVKKNLEDISFSFNNQILKFIPILRFEMS